VEIFPQYGQKHRGYIKQSGLLPYKPHGGSHLVDDIHDGSTIEWSPNAFSFGAVAPVFLPYTTNHPNIPGGSRDIYIGRLTILRMIYPRGTYSKKNKKQKKEASLSASRLV